MFLILCCQCYVMLYNMYAICCIMYVFLDSVERGSDVSDEEDTPEVSLVIF